MKNLHTLLALSASLLLAACGGGGGGTETTPPDQRKATLAASRPGELASYVKDRLRTLESQGRLGSATVWASDGMPTGAAVSPVANASPPPRSSTLVQEAGVDEADLIQTDGSHLYTLQPGTPAAKLAVWRRGGDGRATQLTSLTLATDGANWVDAQGMVFSDNQRALAVVSQNWGPVPINDLCPTCSSTVPAIAPMWTRSSAQVQRIDISDPANTQAGDRIDIDGYLVDSRRIGNRLYVVTQHRPVLAVENLPSTATAAQRAAAIASLQATDLLPRLRRNGGAPQALLSDTDCFVNVDNASTSIQITTVTVFDLASPTLARSSRCFIGGSEAIYMTTSSLYVATSRWAYVGDSRVADLMPSGMKTDIHKFTLSDGSLNYRGSGTIDGHLGWDRERKSLRLSEHNGDLRVLSFTGSFGWWGIQDPTAAPTVAPSPATLTVLRETSGALQVVATLPNSRRPAAIGKAGEQVYAVRFVGDRGYVVTFRRIDPLYVLDLSDPVDPKAVGELEVAGFSDYLFPLAGNLLLGVGKDADTSGRATGVKLALFDVANPTAPAQRASLTFGTSGSSSALDTSRHGLNMLVLGNEARVALPVLLSDTPFGNWRHGLQRVSIDTQAGTMIAKPLIAAASAYTPLDRERAAQIGGQVYFLQGGTLTTHDW